MTNITNSQTWHDLEVESKQMQLSSIQKLFLLDKERGNKFKINIGDISLDYSKNLLNHDTMKLLIDLANERGVEKLRDAMFSGEKINTTENRAVLHVALRYMRDTPKEVDGENVLPQVRTELNRMAEFADAIRSKKVLGATGKPIKNIVNIGIGGSDLGSVMAYEALKYYSDRSITVRFVSNIDAVDIYEKTLDLNAEETLFIIASKTFTTDETMTNAKAARDWIEEKLGKDAPSKHFAASAMNIDKVQEFGISPEMTFAIWDWVGGRYSYYSSVGLSLMIAIGPDNFHGMLSGMDAMDQHFHDAPLDQNMPVLLALISVWNNNFLGAQTEVVLPYSQYLHRLPAYLQQLVMESNGKSVTKEGSPVDYHTSTTVWGEAGTNGQHSFYQLLHQGTRYIPVDLIGISEKLIGPDEHFNKLNSNLQAQAEALAFGKNPKQLRGEGCTEDLIPHRTFSGNRPSNTIMMSKLTPNTLGQLIALYEHKVFVMGAIWGINSFDQFGVELGKELAKKIYESR